MTKRALVRGFILFLYTALLFAVADSLSLSYFEVSIYFGDDDSLLYYPLHAATSLLGQNDLAVRSVMIGLHLISIALFYLISKPYIEKERDRIWNIIFFVLLPGSVSSALIVHNTGLILMLLLLFIYGYQRFSQRALWILPLYLFIDASFFILFLALAVYMTFLRKGAYAFFSLIMMIGSVALFGFIGKGAPVNFLGETLSILSVVFSPLLFFYFLYVLFRIAFREEKDLIWMISTVALLLMMLLSIRQKVPLEQFAPYYIIMLPLMVRQFMHSYRLRIRALRKGYKIFFTIALVSLFANSMTIYFNKLFYLYIDSPKEHFLYEHYIAKELAQELKKRGIDTVKSSDPRLQKRLSFYGIGSSQTKTVLDEGKCKNVTISYIKREVSSFCVTKNNTNAF